MFFVFDFITTHLLIILVLGLPLDIDILLMLCGLCCFYWYIVWGIIDIRLVCCTIRGDVLISRFNILVLGSRGRKKRWISYQGLGWEGLIQVEASNFNLRQFDSVYFSTDVGFYLN